MGDLPAGDMIESVHRARSAWNAPMLSSDRLFISYSTIFFAISKSFYR